MEISEVLAKTNSFFNTNSTKDIDFRIEQLHKLKKTIKKYEAQVKQALKDDLRKPEFEIYSTELGVVYSEIDFALKNIKKWARPERVRQPFFLYKSKGMIYKEPYGTALIIGPYNYPFQLLFTPLVGAISAGCCAVLKPSKNTPATARVIKAITDEAFRSDYIVCLVPQEHPNTELVNSPFDYIFFTGSIETARSVAEAAGRNLIPYTLELGGKSPTIVDDTANLEVAAKRIVWGKFLNLGQTCIAPDYIFVKKSVKQELIAELVKSIKFFYGPIAQESTDLGRIINDKEFERLHEIIVKESENIIHGGQTDRCGLYIEPTLLDIKSPESPSMQEEIFGPILPVMTWENIDEVIDFIRKRPKPLGLYVFSKNEEVVRKILESISFGGGCVNDTLNHLLSPKMPFGGIGLSGIGQYHGKYSFDTFSHQKAILFRNADFERNLTFPPYTKELMRWVKRIFR